MKKCTCSARFNVSSPMHHPECAWYGVYEKEQKEKSMNAKDREDVVVTVLNTLAEQCNNYAVSKGFWKDEDTLLRIVAKYSHQDDLGTTDIVKGKLVERILTLFNNEKIALEMSELAERLEVLRKDSAKRDEHCPEFLNVEIECADLIIRCLDFCGRRHLDIGGAVIAKMKYNSGREYMHGKKF